MLVAAAVFFAPASATAGVAVTGGTGPGATSWAGTPIAASVSDPAGQATVSEGFGGSNANYAQTFTVPVSNSYQLDRICIYAGTGAGTSESAPLTINLYDLGEEVAPNPNSYTASGSLLGGGNGLPITYTSQSNGILQFDFDGSDRVTLQAGHLYAFEIVGVAGTNPMNLFRTGTDTYSSGAAYRNRSWINGNNARDIALAVYGTVAAPAGVTVTGGTGPGATSWAGTPIAASVSNPAGQATVSEGFGGTNANYAQTFTVSGSSSYQLDRICIYAGGGTGTSGSAPLTINLYDLGEEVAPNPNSYTASGNLLGGGNGLSITYTTQSNGILQFDFHDAERVTLQAGHLYAFEIVGVAGTNPMNLFRTGADTYSGGAAYRNRSWINGTNAREMALAVYGTVATTSGVTVTGGTGPGATSWAGTPIVATVSDPAGQATVSEGFGGTNANYAQTFTIPVSSSYQLDRICIYAGSGTGTSESAPLTINLYDLGGQVAPNPSGYTASGNLLGGGSGLSITYTTQSNGILQFDFHGEDRVTLLAGRMYAFEIVGVAGTNPMNLFRTGADTYSGGAAYRNRSWINGTNAREIALALYGTPAEAPPTSSTINAGTPRQVIDGFGAGTAFLDGGLDPLSQAQMDALYGTGTNQMGLSLLRVRITPTGGSSWNAAVANGQKAVAHGARILASPWTPPAAMKSNGALVHGSLLESEYANYVAHLNSFTDTMEAGGAPVAVVSVQNEPDFDPDYEGCVWTAEQLRVFCRDFAGDLKVPVMMPEAFGFNHALSDATLNDAAAAANMDYIGGHLYGATIQDYPLARSKGKPIWMTEYLENDQTIDSAIATAQQIQDCLTIGNMSAYIWWKTIGNANGLLNATGVLQPRAYVMAQFSRFVRPGDRRIDVPSNDSALGVSAFLNAVGDKLTIIVVNPTGAAVDHTFTLQGGSTSSMTPWVTSATQSLAEQTAVPVDAGSFSFTVPAKTVITFVGAVTVPPQINDAPLSQTATAGGAVTFSVGATGTSLSYQWQFRREGTSDWVDLLGATGTSVSFASVQGFHAGAYRVVVSSGTASVTSSEAVLTADAPAASVARVQNLSTRALCLTGDDVLIPGFFVQGTGTKRLLMRAVGPELTRLGVADPLADPQIVLKRRSDDSIVATNEDWGDNSNWTEIRDAAAAVFAFSLTEGSKDAALLLDLPAGGYTIVASGHGEETGVSIVELYDISGSGDTAQLINISNRGFVGIGGNIMIPGFVVSEEGSRTFLIRAVGPSLSRFNVTGVLADPKIEVYKRRPGTATDDLILTNDTWGENGDAAQVRQTATAVGAFSLTEASADAAFVVTLPPGAYTVNVKGAGDTTGVGLVEVYLVP